MAGNAGKFIDRSPIICAAGKPSGDPKKVLTVEDTLKEYKVVDAITALEHNAHIWREEPFKPPLELPPIRNPCFLGTKTEIKQCMDLPVRNRFQELIADLKETTYDSYWNKQVGKVRDPTQGLPKGMIPLEVTMGTPSVRDIPLKELVNPPKTPYEVLWDSQVGHEMYRKTHNDYNPSEQVNRGYKSPPFFPDKCFGKKTRYDARGIWVRCCCDWHQKEPVVHASKIQANYLDRNRPQLGKPLAPNQNIKRVPEGHRFGKRSESEIFGVETLLRDPGSDPCLFKREYYRWLMALNKFRLKIKERRVEGFSFNDFLKRVLYWDKEKTGILPIDTFYEVCACHDLTFPKEPMENLMSFLRIIQNDKIDYRRFIDLIDLNSSGPPIQLKPFSDVSPQNLYFVTTSQAASCDYLIIDNSAKSVAGIPSVRSDLDRPIVPPGGCRADLDNLGEDTTARALLNPSIYTRYGLNFRDFYLPRPPDVIRKLFTKLGYNLSDDLFEELWKKGLEVDKTPGEVSVETFKQLLRARFPHPKITIDEAECERLP
nr:unnamed protein product [Callosobruchus analis]